VPLARPLLSELVDRVRGDIHGRLEIAGPLLRRAMADVIGAVVGGAVHMLYGAQEWLSRQLFGDTADEPELIERAAMFGITRAPATFASGSVYYRGTVGAVVPTDTIIRLDSVTAFRVTTGQTLTLNIADGGGEATVPVTALLAGLASNVPVGTLLAFEGTVPNVTSPGTVTAGGIIGGADQEAIETLRARYLLRLREPPEGGADQDYEGWALAVAGVTRAWVFPNELGKGTVVVRFVEDNNPVSIFPDAGAVALVQAAENAQRPTTAQVVVVAPTNLAVAFTIHVVPDNADTRAAVSPSSRTCSRAKRRRAA
jgi:uncharacterized phage protein gp47/JayE